jgi:hypothetical protein
MEDELPDGLWKERERGVYRFDRRPSLDGLEFAALACLLAGATIAGPPSRLSRSRPRPTEHFITDEPLTKRQKRRLRGKTKGRRP